MQHRTNKPKKKVIQLIYSYAGISYRKVNNFYNWSLPQTNRHMAYFKVHEEDYIISHHTNWNSAKKYLDSRCQYRGLKFKLSDFKKL